MPGNESKIPVGTVLVGKYSVVKEIGRGGMAAVYEAKQLSLNKKVAVKVLASELSASAIVIERFFREARAAASVKSPYIVDVYDSGRLDDGRPFIAMELLEGESLYDRMARVRIIDIDTTIRVIVHTAKGLVKAHGAGIVHRDLKPENIYLTTGEDGTELCKILDFGLAKFYEPVNPEDKSQKRLTREGAVFGTPAYMSPEQVKGQGSVDHRADLWALGCMAFECLIGRPVWNMDQGVAMTFAAIAAGPIPVPSQIRADLPLALDVWFKKCLERDPARRYQSAKELADAFIESWGQRPSSSASFPHVMPATHSHRDVGQAALPPTPPPPQAGDLLASEMNETVRPGPSTGRGGGPHIPGPPNTGRFPQDDTTSPLLPGGEAPVSSEQTPTRTSPLKIAASASFLVASVSAVLFVWVRFLNPQVFTPVVISSASAKPTAAVSTTPGQNGVVVDEPKWSVLVAEGQKLFSLGKVSEAGAKFKEASAEPGGAVVGKVYADQIKFATEAKGACRVAAFSHPRISTDKPAERPTIAATAKGALFAWTDDHEQTGRDHVYGVMLDATGKALGAPKDLTPEATKALRPHLVAHGADRFVLLYSDVLGRDAGVRARLLDGEGRIDLTKGQSVLVGAARKGDFWPAIGRGPQGFFVVWQDDRDKEGDFDVFVRRLTNDLDTDSAEMRLTDYVAAPKSKTGVPKVRFPSVAVAANTLLVAYKLEQEKEKNIWRLRIPLASLDKGLEDSKDPNRTSRTLGDALLVTEDKAPGDAPAIACGKEGCFVVWHGEPGGAFAAMIDPKEGKVIWRKRFSEKGGRPSLAVNEAGQVAVTFFDPEKREGRLKIAILSRDASVNASTLLKAPFELQARQRPSVAPGTEPNEWYVAWEDLEGGRPEVYAARVVCR